MKLSISTSFTSHPPRTKNKTYPVFKGFLTYKNAEGVEKMINTDVIEQISKVELKREFMRPHFSVKYIFDAVQMFFKGDNRIQTNGTKNSKINFRASFIENTDSMSFGEFKNYSTVSTGHSYDRIESQTSSSIRQGKIFGSAQVDETSNTNSIVLDKSDILIMPFNKFSIKLKEAFNNGFASINSKPLPRLNENYFCREVESKIPINWKMYKEFDGEEHHTIEHLPSVDELQKGLKEFEKDLRKEYKDTLRIEYYPFSYFDNGYEF